MQVGPMPVATQSLEAKMPPRSVGAATGTTCRPRWLLPYATSPRSSASSDAGYWATVYLAQDVKHGLTATVNGG